MPMFQKLVAELNVRLHQDRVEEFAKRAEALGWRIEAGLLLDGGPKYEALAAYLNALPGSFRESLSSVLRYALENKPYKPLTFAWAPAYDFEMSIWESPCGITVMYRSRYPADPHPTRANAEGRD
jgi:hypothetical protein